MTLYINGVEIEDTFAEGFKMWGARVIITGKNRKWALEAATKMSGFATSVIGCKCEAGIEGEVADTPDGRPGFSVLLFTPSKDDLPKRLMERIGQTVMTCPTTACFNGLVSDTTMSIGGQAALLWRWLSGQQAHRRPPVLAHPGHGGRVPD